MPNDSLLGEFAKEFAGRLGEVEESPGHSKKKGGESFAGAHEIIDSDSLRKLMDKDPREHIDARAMLTARLMDVYLNDIDRHPGQWKWARLKKGVDSPWEPIPRDRDQAFVAYHGVLIGIARMGAPNLVKFDGNISIPGLTYNSLEMDRRLLASLERPVWDSIATELTRRLTDQVIDSAVHKMPVEYWPTAPAMAATLRLRRDNLRAAATRFYLYLAAVVDVHGTDAADRATVRRLENGIVEVKLESGGEQFFLRRFDARETHEIRIYLHGGDDSSFVAGDVARSIPVKIIGGNGVNWLSDSSTVGGSKRPSTIIDQGETEGVDYGPDTLFFRRPYVEVNGKLEQPGVDRGSKLVPVLSIRSDLELGITPRLGADYYTYGFRKYPYASVIGAEAEHAISLPGWRFAAHADKRFEDTPLHIEGSASYSQFAELTYHGLGNDTPDSSRGFFDVRQRQTELHAALGIALGKSSDLSIGPVVKLTQTDSIPNRFIAITRPYGFGDFNEAGLRVAFHHEVYDRLMNPTRHFKLDIYGTAYPVLGDVKNTFEDLAIEAGQQATFPVAFTPTLVWRIGARKVFGDFPYFESAFIGENHTVRRLEPQRYAGDAAVYASSELRIPLADFAVLLPMQWGVIGTAESARVYVGSASPGGWHNAFGGGLWVGLKNQSFIVSCTATSENGHKGPHCQTGLVF